MNLRAKHDQINKDKTESGLSNKTLKNKRVCFTGRLNRFSRAGAKKAIRGQGAKYMENVTKQTDILIVGTMRYQTSKYDKAVNYNVEIMQQSTFYNLLKLPKGGGFVE